MSLMEWNDKLKVGHGRIDSDHKQLVDLINQLSDAMRAGQGKEVCGKVLNNLVIYTKTHFAMEEQLMSAHKYAGLAEHKAEHDKLLQEVLDFKSKLDSGAVTLSVSLLNFLKDWLTRHILGSDKALAATLAVR